MAAILSTLVACGSVGGKTDAAGGGGAGGKSSDAGAGTGGASGTGGALGAGGASAAGGAGGSGTDGGVLFRGHIETIIGGAPTGSMRLSSQSLTVRVTKTCGVSKCFSGGIVP